MSEMIPSTPGSSKGAIPKKRSTNSNDGQGCSSQQRDFYPLRIRHVCNNCADTLRFLIDNNELQPLKNAEICTCCDHKSMHQPYYNLCSICARLERKCAMCLDPLNEDHIDPFSTLLTPEMESVLEELPDMFQRRLCRFIFKRWEFYLKRQWIPLKQFQKEYIKMCQGIFFEIKYLNDQQQYGQGSVHSETNSADEEEIERQRVENEALRHENRAKHFSKLEQEWVKMEQQRQLVWVHMAEWNQSRKEEGKETATDDTGTEDEENDEYVEVEVTNIEETLEAVMNKLNDLQIEDMLKDGAVGDTEIEELQQKIEEANNPDSELFLDQEGASGFSDGQDNLQDDFSDLDEDEQRQLQELLLKY